MESIALAVLPAETEDASDDDSNVDEMDLSTSKPLAISGLTQEAEDIVLRIVRTDLEEYNPAANPSIPNTPAGMSDFPAIPYPLVASPVASNGPSRSYSPPVYRDSNQHMDKPAFKYVQYPRQAYSSYKESTADPEPFVNQLDDTAQETSATDGPLKDHPYSFQCTRRRKYKRRNWREELGHITPTSQLQRSHHSVRMMTVGLQL